MGGVYLMASDCGNYWIRAFIAGKVARIAQNFPLEN